MISYLKEEISNSTDLYWFKSSNKYVVVDKKFSELLSLKLSDNNKFIRKIQDSPDLSEKKIIEINNQMNEFISECTDNFKNKILKTERISKTTEIYVKYTFNNKTIKVCFDSQMTKDLINPKFLHLQSNEDHEISGELTVFSENKVIYLFNKDRCIGGWTHENMHEFQGKFSMELTSFFYAKVEDDWMGVLHASALEKNNEAIILTGDSGNGKSSLTTILMASGFNFVSDDFTPILSDDSSIYSFPSAISIKENFFNKVSSIYNDFEKLKSYYINDIKGWVKYLPPKFKDLGPFNCNKVIHVQYDVKGPNTLNKIDKTEAIKQFLPDAWIASDEKHAKKFIDWVINTEFYSLHYGNNEKAINLINKLK